jgi:hypothetical protein
MKKELLHIKKKEKNNKKEQFIYIRSVINLRYSKRTHEDN